MYLQYQNKWARVSVDSLWKGSVRTNGVSILRGLNLDICRGFLSPETKPTVSNNEVSMKWVSIRWG